MMATIREIAELAGVSPATVSRVMNGNVPVRENARNKVLSAIRRIENQSRVMSDSPLSRRVGIIMPATSAINLPGHPSLYSIVISFIEALNSRHIGNTTIVLDGKSSIEDLVQRADAYLVLGTSEEQEEKLLPWLLGQSSPFMFINRQVDNKHASSINIDDEQATEIAVNYLLGLGHKKIAFIGGNQNYRNTRLRYKSYNLSLSKVGIEPDEKYVLYGEYAEASGYEMGARLLAMKDRPTAACVASDSIAIGLMRYLTEQGLSLPEDFSVIGFGNVEAAEYVSPPLTTISQNSFDMGHIAASALLQMMENPSISRQQIRLKTELVVRNSCAPLEKEKILSK